MPPRPWSSSQPGWGALGTPWSVFGVLFSQNCKLRAAELAPAWRCSLGTILGGGWDPWGDVGHCLAASSVRWWLLRDSTSALQSGALLACGIVNSGVRNECDPALALLSDYVLHNSNTMRIGAIFG